MGIMPWPFTAPRPGPVRRLSAKIAMRVGSGGKARRAPMPRGGLDKVCLVDSFESDPALADDLGLCHFHECHSDTGAKQLQGDFLIVAEFDTIAIGAMFEPRESD